MAEVNSLESLEALYADLQALSEGRIATLDRLWFQLERHIKAFQSLLEKNPRNEKSRQTLAAGNLEFEGEKYSVNDQFKQDVLILADDLNLDELEAAQIYFKAQQDSEYSEQPPLTNAITRFHQRRKYLLESLRLIIQQAGVDDGQGFRGGLGEAVTLIVQHPRPSSQTYIQACLSSMDEIKSWLCKLAERVNSASIIGQGQQPELFKTIEYQRLSLIKQHETLSIIASQLVKGNAKESDFELVLSRLKKADKFDNLLFHYFPLLSGLITYFGGKEQGQQLDDIRKTHSKFFAHPENDPWTLLYVRGAVYALWLAEYSGNYVDSSDCELPDNQLEDELRERSRHFNDALKDGAFDFILALSADTKPVEWQDPARQGMRIWLQGKAPAGLADSVPFEDFFQEALMEQLEVFIEGFITNLPDVLRKLRVDEDEQRQLSIERDHDLFLEKFVVTISYTYEGRPKSACQSFWDVPDGALLGFVQWASRRASTPLVSAFCEMLQAISGDETCATEAHKFLNDEHTQASGKMRRTHSLTWSQIFKELTYFSSKIRDTPALPQTQTYRVGRPSLDFIETEPESSLMLESYLRLITRLCSESRAVREFLRLHPTFNIQQLLLQLASSSIGARLRACAFSTLRSLLSQKTKEAGEYLWTELDAWTNGSYAPGSAMSKSSYPSTPAAALGPILSGIASGFEEPYAFIGLLNALVAPYHNEQGLNDGLPFPENLGASVRQPGINPYVDFTLSTVFATQAEQPIDGRDSRMLQLACLDFIATCLGTFNEDLVIFASQANVTVDSAIQTTNLQTYVLIHPFSRVMEWIFNERAMAALFAAVHQDPEEVARSAPDSPLVQTLLCGLRVIGLVLDLQPTYLDIIRPLIKSQSNSRREDVSSPAFGSFEDGVLSHITIIPDLGRYCGCGHTELVVVSLKLLEKLSSSPKLASSPASRLGRPSDRARVLAALDDDAETISKILLREMRSEIDEAQGPESDAYVVRDCILNFLIACLQAAPGQQTIAHLLLGFRCGVGGLGVDPQGPFSRNASLFHTILDQVLGSPVTNEEGIVSWLVSLSYKGLQVLKELWTSPMSSEITITEMRACETFFTMFAQENTMVPGTTWDGVDIADPSFSLSKGAYCLSEFLGRRALILQYLSSELRQIARRHAPSLKERVFETLLGSTTMEDGKKLDHSNIFNFFDFLDPDFPLDSEIPQLSWFSEVDINACLDYYEDDSPIVNLPKLEELLSLRRFELSRLHAAEMSDARVADAVNSQAQDMFDFCKKSNQIKIIGTARLNVLRAWVQLTLVMIQTGDFDSASKTSFVLKSLQTILPRLESNLEAGAEAIELARLAKALMFSLDFDSESFKQGDMGDLVSDRLFHLFQVSLRAINTLGSKVELKEYFYNICYRYLAGMSDITGLSGIHRRHSIQTIKSAGERFIDLICDDAHSGEPTCRISALLVLGALVKMGKNENSKYIVESLKRLNFIGILVDSIQSISIDLRKTPAEDTDLQLSYIHARLALLLHLSQTRFGANAVLNAGLFHSISSSSLFSIDPDLGVDIQGPQPLQKHYLLLLSLTRIILSCILSLGSQNASSLEQGRKFLAENRLSILAVLKKGAGIGGMVDGGGKGEGKGDGEMIVVEELAEAFMVGISVTGFLDFEDQTTQKRQVKKFTVFT